MKKATFWAAISVTDKNGKNHAHSWRFDSNSNLLSQLKKFNGANIIHLCNTKKEACELVDTWNKIYKENNTCMFSNEPLF